MIAPNRWLLAVLVPVLAVGVAGCGEDRDEGAGTDATATGEAAAPAGEPVATLQLEEADFEIKPRDARVDRSGVVRIELRNTGQTDHALEVETPEGERETEPFGPGQTATLEVLLPPGEHKMYCPVGDHEQRGMTGTITVPGDGGSGSGGGEEEGGGEEDGGGGGGSVY